MRRLRLSCRIGRRRVKVPFCCGRCAGRVREIETTARNDCRVQAFKEAEQIVRVVRRVATRAKERIEQRLLER